MDNNGIELPDSLSALIRNEKREGIKKFNNSDFEKKIYNRIRDQKRGRSVSLKWILVPASLVLAAVFLIPYRSKVTLPDSLQGQIRSALETVSLETKDIVTDSFFGNLDIPTREDGGSIKELTMLIDSAIRTVEGASKINISCCEDHVRDRPDQLREEISRMTQKDDYSELFSRIIDKLTEG